MDIQTVLDLTRKLDDDDFVKEAYRMILLREPDAEGFHANIKLLASGRTREDAISDLLNSDEYHRRVIRELKPLQNLIELRPDKYSRIGDILIFHADTSDDVDWLEICINNYDYYEVPGVWSLSMDDDKRLMAEILASLQPSKALELGCSCGAVMQCLSEMGIYCDGVEISQLAIDHADNSIRHRIYKGDLLSLNITKSYDLIFGLDLFEHLNPRRIKNYLQTIYKLLIPEGICYANIPAFCDSYPRYLPNDRIHVDEKGYPLHGHLTWEDASWWDAQFAEAGFIRDQEAERKIHAAYDERMAIMRRQIFIYRRQSSRKGSISP